MIGRNYELPDDITTLGGMVIFELINGIFGVHARVAFISPNYPKCVC